VNPKFHHDLMPPINKLLFHNRNG